MSAGASNLEALKATWQQAWPAALACWSRFVQLTEPRWCATEAEEKQEQLTGSFAMIRLVDHAIVISIRQVEEQGLQPFAVEILAHEIGHHVYCPADLTDNARSLARIRAGLPTRENDAPFIANLYTDLLINDRLQRAASLNMAGVYQQLAMPSQSRLWTLYMRIYEILWKLDRGSLARGPIHAQLDANRGVVVAAEITPRLDSDAMLGARLIRSYAKDWIEGAGRFAVLCLPYLLEDKKNQLESLRASWHDTRCAGCNGMPEGLVEIEDAEGEGAIHPAEDESLTGIESEIKPDPDGEVGIGVGKVRDTKDTGRKTLKKYRGPLEYSQVLKATGLDLSAAEITARYYRERAMPYLVKFPSRIQPQAIDPLPEGLDVWDIGSSLDEIDWLGTVTASPIVVPGVTTRQRLFGDSPGTTPQKTPIDLYLGVDCSGSMGDPSNHLSFPVLAGAIIALSALRAGSRVMVALSGEPGKTITTDGFVRNEKAVLSTLTSYLGTGSYFGIHRLDETFRDWPKANRQVHILVVSDSDIFSSLESSTGGRKGWDVAKNALEKCRGGATYVLELPQYQAQQKGAAEYINPHRRRMETDGWNVSPVSTMSELVEFARKFSQMSYGVRRVAAAQQTQKEST